MEIDLPDSPETVDDADETDYETHLEEYSNWDKVSEAMDQDLHDNIGSAPASDSQVPEDYDSIEAENNLASNSAAFNYSSSSASNIQVPEDYDSIVTDDNAASNFGAFNPSIPLQSLPSKMNSSKTGTIGNLIEYLATCGNPQLNKISKVNVEKLNSAYMNLHAILNLYNGALYDLCYLAQSGINCVHNTFHEKSQLFFNEVVTIKLRSQTSWDINDRANDIKKIHELNNFMLFYYQEFRSILKNLAQLVYKLYVFQGKFLKENLQVFFDSLLLVFELE